MVIALGGNALGKTPSEQLQLVRSTAETIVALASQGNEIIVTHGNGPQVGMINLAMEFAAANGAGTAPMPFAECGAMSQGYIGYHLQQAIGCQLSRAGLKRQCVSVITQVVVDADDPAFNRPTKPVGMFYDKKQALALTGQNGYTFMEDAGRGWRRVVASPMPLRIVEQSSIEQLLADNDIVIAAGGGGIPVVQTADGLQGVAAVIDKDLTSARLALDIGADMLVILTAVDSVCLNYGKPDCQPLESLNALQIEQYSAEGQFAVGSMLPKVKACLQFVSGSRNDGTALITSLNKAEQALKGLCGTVITR